MSGDCEDVSMASLAAPMSQDDATSADKDSDSDEYSGDEVDDEDFLGMKGSPHDDIDGPFTTLYNKVIGKYFDCPPRRQKQVKSKPAVHHSVASNVYDFSYPQRGLAVIINNEKFTAKSDLKNRRGSSCDAKDLQKMFKNMGFKVKMYTDLTGEQMVLKLKKIAANLKYDHKKADCFACTILSHGEANEVKPEKPPYDMKERHDVVFGVDGMLVPTKIMIELFSDRCCPELEGKPRLFFIQACRGTALDVGMEIKVWRVKKKKQDSSKKRPADDIPDAVPGKMSSAPDTKLSDADPIHDCMPLDLEDLEPTHDAMSQDLEDLEPTHDAMSQDLEDLEPTHDAMSQDLEDLEPTQDQHPNESLQDDTTDAGAGSSGITILPAPIYKDFLVMYASPPGFFSWRRSTGAWLIQSLKTVMHDSDLSSIPLNKLLTRVSQKVARDYESSSSDKAYNEKKQVPCIMSMLTKDIYFKPKN